MPDVRTKMQIGYLPKDQIQTKINSGDLDAYDVVYTNDTWECLFITPELELKPVRGRVKTYNSVQEAEIDINQSADTYEGQLVAIKSDLVFRAYIVNRNSIHYYLVPSWENPEPINYDELNNRPILNIVGSIDNPIIIKNLSNGVYKVTGFFKLSLNSEAESSVVGNIVIVEDRYITKISNKEIKKYNKENDDEEEYVTEVGTRNIIESYNYVTEVQMAQYIQEHFESQVEKIVEDVLSEMFTPATDQQIINLF